MKRLTYDFEIGGNHCWQVKGADNLECREVCERQGDDGCKTCPIAKAFDRLASIEDILGNEYDLERLKFIMDAERHGGLIVRYPRDDPGPKGPPGVCPGCGRYEGISWDAKTDVSTCALCGWANTEAALRREQDEQTKP